MEAATWQRYVQMGERDAGSTEFEAVLRYGEDFELGEPWDADFDPLDDEDPE